MLCVQVYMCGVVGDDVTFGSSGSHAQRNIPADTTLLKP